MRRLLYSLVMLACAARIASADEYGPSPPPPPVEGPQPPPPMDQPPPPPDAQPMQEPHPHRPPDEYYQQPPPPPPPLAPAGFQRHQAFFGGGLGLGTVHLDCASCDEADGISLTLDLGWMIGRSKRFAVVGDLWLNGGDAGYVKVSQSALGLGVRYFANDSVWLQGTFALGQLDTRPKGGPTEVRGGPGVDVAVGLELKKWRRSALDLRVRLGVSDQGDPKSAAGTVGVRQLGVLVGYTWY